MKSWSLHREDLMTPGEWARLRASLNAQAELAETRGSWTAVQTRSICFTAVWTGLRREELAALNIGDLHLTNENPYMTVRHGKGDKYREVVISPECRVFLKRFLKAKEHAGQALDEKDPLFVPQRGERFTGDGIYRVWKSACKRAGTAPRSIHKARHLFATALYAATKDLRLVQKQLGHSRVTTTTVYADVDDDQTMAGMAALDKRLRKAVPVTPETRRVKAKNRGKAAGNRDGLHTDFSSSNVSRLPLAGDPGGEVLAHG